MELCTKATRLRSRWSTCRPLLAHRAESAHQRRAERPRSVEDLHRPPAQPDPVLAVRLHPRSGDRPHSAGRVDLGLCRQPHLTEPGRGQH